MTKLTTTLAAGLAAVTLGAATLATTAEAAPRGGAYVGRANPGGVYYGFRGSPGYGARAFAPRYGYGYGHRSYRPGFGVGAGLVGGLALGALAASTYPYYAPTAYSYGDCYLEPRRVVDAWGRVFVQQVQVCY